MYETVLHYINLARPRNSISVIIAVCIGYAWLSSTDLKTMSIAALVMFLINSAATVANDISDINIDASSGRTSPLLAGNISIENARRYEILLIISALLLSLLYLPYLGAIICLALSVMFAWIYNNAPFYASRKPIASILVLSLCVGVLTILFGAYSANLPITISIYLLAAGWFFQRASLALYKDFKDYSGDKLNNKQTYLVRYGKTNTKIMSLMLYSIGTLVVAAALYSKNSTFALVWLILSICIGLTYRIISIKKKTNSENKKVFIRALVISNILDLGILLWLLIY